MISYTSVMRCVLYVFLCVSRVANSGHAQMLGLDEGEICKSRDDESLSDYVCQYIDNCTTVMENIQKQIAPQLCSFSGSVPIVCCPPANAVKTVTRNIQTIPKRKHESSEEKSRSAVEMCREYSELIYTYEKNPPMGSTDGYVKVKDCHYIQDYISGGTTVYPKEFPHMALLGYHEKVDTNRWGCGGTLISNRWILSAAHCQKIGKSHYVLWARLGDLNYLSDADDARPEDYRITRRVIHPEYRPPSVYHDIALFHLERAVRFSAYVRPVCLNADKSLDVKHALATGWGQIGYGISGLMKSYEKFYADALRVVDRESHRHAFFPVIDGPTSADLLQVVLNIVPADQCDRSYSSSTGRNLSHGIDNRSQLCAGHLAGGKDTCGGDSGGPLQIPHPNYTCMHTQIGITSFGKFCGRKDTPGVYTRISNYISWIEQIVWPKRE